MIDRYHIADGAIRVGSFAAAYFLFGLTIEHLLNAEIWSVITGSLGMIMLTFSLGTAKPRSFKTIKSRALERIGFSPLQSNDIRPFARNIISTLPEILASSEIVLQGKSVYIDDENGTGRFRREFDELKGRGLLKSSIAVKWSDPTNAGPVFKRETPRQPFSILIKFGKNRIQIEHALWDKTPITVHIPAGGETISEVLNPSEAQLFFERYEELQRTMFAEMIGCEANLESISTIVALQLQGPFDIIGSISLDDTPDGLTYIHFDPANRSLDQRSEQSWIYHPTIGAMKLDLKEIKSALIKKREHQLLSAFDKRVEPIEKMPPIIGNPAAAKEISVAQRLLKLYPDMRDASGTPIAPLVLEHLPRLVKRHGEAIAAATASNNIDQDLLDKITRDFDEGLKTISRAILEGVEAEQRKTQDDLSVEIAFLKARHPEDTGLQATG